MDDETKYKEALERNKHIFESEEYKNSITAFKNTSSEDFTNWLEGHDN